MRSAKLTDVVSSLFVFNRVNNQPNIFYVRESLMVPIFILFSLLNEVGKIDRCGEFFVCVSPSEQPAQHFLRQGEFNGSYFYTFIGTFYWRHLLLMSEDANVLFFWKLSYLTEIYGGFSQPSESNDTTFQTFDAPIGLALCGIQLCINYACSEMPNNHFEATYQFG